MNYGQAILYLRDIGDVFGIVFKDESYEDTHRITSQKDLNMFTWESSRNGWRPRPERGYYASKEEAKKYCKK